MGCEILAFGSVKSLRERRKVAIGLGQWEFGRRLQSRYVQADLGTYIVGNQQAIRSCSGSDPGAPVPAACTLNKAAN